MSGLLGTGFCGGMLSAAPGDGSDGRKWAQAAAADTATEDSTAGEPHNHQHTHSHTHPHTHPHAHGAEDPARRDSLQAALAKQGMLVERYAFRENKGQWDSRVAYQAYLGGGKLYAEQNRLTYLFYDDQDLAAIHDNRNQHHWIDVHVLRTEWLGAQQAPNIEPWHSGLSRYNYFRGQDPSRWAAGVQEYRELTWRELYPGIDYCLYPEGPNLKDEYRVAPGADPSQIRVALRGSQNAYLNEQGELVQTTTLGQVIDRAPVAWQPHPDGEHADTVVCRYQLTDSVLQFTFPDGYNPRLPLVIDPVRVFSTFTGSTADNWGFTATYDVQGNFYAGGTANDFGYPTTTGAAQAVYAGGDQSLGFTSPYGGLSYHTDIAISCFDSSGSFLRYATYLGGARNEQPHSMVTDSSLNLYVLGTTISSDFPSTGNGFDPTYNDSADIVVFKLDSTGTTLHASTYLGGPNNDGLNLWNTVPQGVGAFNPLHNFYADESRGEIQLDADGNVYIVTSASSPNLPVVGPHGRNKVQGLQTWVLDAYVCRFDSMLGRIDWSTYLGGAQWDAGYGLTFGAGDNLYVVGGTNSTTFPTTPGALNSTPRGGTTDGFIVNLNRRTGQQFAGSYLGTNQADQAYFVETDDTGAVYVVGHTNGAYPIMGPVYNDPNGSQFITKMDRNLNSMLLSTRVGSGRTNPDISLTAFLVDLCGNIYLAGWGGSTSGLGTSSTNGLPVTPNALRGTTDGDDFYLMALDPNMSALSYATFYGATTGPTGAPDHVDGGTSRFDPRGVVYQSACAGCSNPAHTFPTTPGSFSPQKARGNLTALTPNFCNVAAFKIDFQLDNSVRANFTATPTEGCAPLTCQFSNQTINGVSYTWNFQAGPGSTSSQTDPTYTFTQPGTYNVQLVAENVNACNVRDTFVLPIVVEQLGTVDFQAPADTCATTIPFRNLTTGAGNFSWDFGDGSAPSTQTSPTHTYANTGSYNVRLTAFSPNEACQEDTTKTVNLALQGVANFTVSTQPCTLRADFTGTPQNANSSFWDFGDGSPRDTANQSPSHLYPSAGTYTVMQVVNPDSPCPDTMTATVSVSDVSQAGFTPDTVGCDQQLSLTNTSQFANTYRWDFGDGSPPTTTANPNHTYPTGGVYTVQLISEPGQAGCADTLSRQVVVPRVPTADFQVDQTRCNPNLGFRYTGNGGAQFLWDFGDGSPPVTDTAATAHTYANGGAYQVRLIVNRDSLCSDTETRTVTLENRSQASFNTSPIGCDRSLQLTNTSQFASTYRWDFGDGSTSSQLSPLKVYNQSGGFTVRLITNAGTPCADTATQSVWSPTVPTASFTVNQTRCNPRVGFQNLATDAVTYRWDFGDGAASAQPNPFHTYTSGGAYTVQFTVNPDSLCSASAQQVITHEPRSISRFTHQPVGCDRRVELNNISQFASTYRWEFGDGATSNQPNPVHQYSSSGTFPVTLYTNPGTPCADTTTLPVWAPQTPRADFTFQQQLCNPVVQFQPRDTSATQYRWFFGDGAGSIARAPTHTYRGTGLYNVTLLVNPDSLCPDTLTLPLSHRDRSFAQFAAPQIGCDRTFTPINQSTDAQSYIWLLGDGSSSAQPNPRYTYPQAGAYTVQLITNPGSPCADTTQQDIWAPQAPSIQFSAQFTPCVPEVQFVNTSTNATHYRWDFGDGAASVLANPQHTYPGPGSYNVELTANPDSNCTVSLQRRVEILPVSQASFTAPPIGCDQQLTFQNTSQFANTFLWDFGDGDSSAFASPSHQYPATPDTYTVQLITNPGTPCADTAQQSLPVPVTPRAGIRRSQVPCQPTVDFRAETDFGRNFRWDFGDGDSAFQQNPSHSYPQPGDYPVVLTVSPNSPCPGREQDSITILPRSQAGFRYDSVGCDSRLNLDNTSQFASSFHWDMGDGAQYANRVNPSHTYNSPGRFRVQLITNRQTSCADTLDTLVYVPSPARAGFTYTQGLCNPQLQFTDTSMGAQQYRWDFGDGVTSTLPNPAHTFGGVGNFAVELVVNPDSVCSDTVVQSVFIQPQSVADFSLPNPGCNLQLSPVNTSQFASSFRWEFGNPFDPAPQTGAAPTYQYPERGVYRIKLVTEPGTPCADSLERSVYIPGPPNPQFTANVTPCTPEVPFQYTGGDASGVVWDFGDGAQATGFAPTHRYTEAGTYTVRLTAEPDSLCSASLDSNIQVTVQSVADFQVQDTACSGGVQVANLSRQAGGYLWDFGNGETSLLAQPNLAYTQGGDYLLTLVTNPGQPCPDTLQRPIHIVARPVVDLVYRKDTCSRQVNFLALGDRADSYRWTLGDGAVRSTVTNQLLYTYAEEGSMLAQVEAQPESRCPGLDSTPVYSGSPVVTDFGWPETVCGLTVTFANLGSHPQAALWSFGDSTPRVAAANPTHTFPEPGSYTVQLITAANTTCADTLAQTVTVEAGPQASFSLDPDSCTGRLFLVNSSTGAVDYQWLAPNGQISNTQTEPSSQTSGQGRPWVQFTTGGEKTVSLVAVDERGCRDTFSYSFPYSPDGLGYLFVPNVFSPNNDGSNDFFRLVGEGRECVTHLQIFDRWGNVLFEANNANTPWDGSTPEGVAPEGVYVIVVKVGGEVFQVGTVTLIR